jgi:hypothetical protein
MIRMTPFYLSHFRRSLARLPLISSVLTSVLIFSLLLVGGCSGSQLGDTLGKNLEPDPQLADNPVSLGGQPDAPNNAPSNSPNNGQSEPSPAPSANQTEPEPTKPTVVAGDYKDIGQAPEEIQPYLTDLIELDLLQVRSPANTGTNAQPKADEFRPNQAATRREYARWLLAANNRFYADQGTRKIRPGVTSSQPAFKDVPVSDPDFGAIQGLAEAGIIASPLTGSTTALTFRPDAPLTRKDLLLWKVPLDTRSPLPQATPAAVTEAWGFQDAAKIEPRALQAVLADYQNGDFANIRRAFNYTTLFQPDKAATRAEVAAVLWRFGNATEGITAAEIRNPSADPSPDSTRDGARDDAGDGAPTSSLSGAQ